MCIRVYLNHPLPDGRGSEFHFYFWPVSLMLRLKQNSRLQGIKKQNELICIFQGTDNFRKTEKF